MFQIDIKNRKPIYEQVVDNFKRLIMSGVLKENEKAPSVRELAALLTVNPNTIQKAYRELETLGYFYTVSGQGNFIAAPPEYDNPAQKTALYEQLHEIARELLYMGESRDDIIKRIERV